MANTKKLRVNVTVPEGFEPGDTFVIEVEVPSGRGHSRRNNKPIEEMTREELKREIINAGSVLYKAQKRGADDDVIARNQERLEAARALMAEKFPKPERVKRVSSHTGPIVMQAEARVLSQDEIDHPENYMETDDSADGDIDSEAAAEI